MEQALKVISTDFTGIVYLLSEEGPRQTGAVCNDSARRG